MSEMRKNPVLISVAFLLIRFYFSSRNEIQGYFLKIANPLS